MKQLKEVDDAIRNHIWSKLNREKDINLGKDLRSLPISKSHLFRLANDIVQAGHAKFIATSKGLFLLLSDQSKAQMEGGQDHE